MLGFRPMTAPGNGFGAVTVESEIHYDLCDVGILGILKRDFTGGCLRKFSNERIDFYVVSLGAMSTSASSTRGS
jgi:hypothetical protein